MRRRGLMGLAALLPVRAAWGQSADMRSFRTQALQILRQKYPDIRAKPGNEDSVIETDRGLVDLTNIQATVRHLPVKQRQAALADSLEELLEQVGRAGEPKTIVWAEASKLLRPRLVPPNIRLTVPELVLRGFATGALMAYVLDHARHLEYVARHMLESWEVDSQRVHDTAIANLETLSETVPIGVREARGGGLFVIIGVNDSYDAARLVLPRFRRRLLEKLGDPIFVGIPNRDFLVAWSADNAQFAKFVARVEEDFGQEPYPITDTVFRVDREGIRPATAEERRGR
jgi:hypothetical protein